MNERIKQLANKATRIVETTDHCSGASESHTEVDLAKFAELIVRECAGIDFRHKIGLSSDQDYDVSKTIKEHFGVEE